VNQKINEITGEIFVDFEFHSDVVAGNGQIGGPAEQ
jgi:hypothetical protein